MKPTKIIINGYSFYLETYRKGGDVIYQNQQTEICTNSDNVKSLFFFCPSCKRVFNANTNDRHNKKLIQLWQNAYAQNRLVKMVDENNCANLCYECFSDYLYLYYGELPVKNREKFIDFYVNEARYDSKNSTSVPLAQKLKTENAIKNFLAMLC